MKLSACLLTFNEDRWIDLCIEHMYDYVDEIVCLDAGSTDNTLSVISKYDKVRYYVVPQPSPLRGRPGWHEGDRRNILQSAARGEWVLCLGCDELIEDAAWENIYNWLNDGSALGWGFYRINYMYNFDWHKPIHQPNNGGEVRIYRNLPQIKWEVNNAHNFLRCYKDQFAADRNLTQHSVRMYDHQAVTNTKYLIHHMHQTSIRGHAAVHNRRDEVPGLVTEEYVRTHGFHRTEDNKYSREIKYPQILHDKGII